MYVKLFGRMLRSSIMDEDVQTRWAFVVMLLASDKTGMVYGTPGALARTANLSVSDFEAALGRLMAPDLNSTTPDEDGRRVVMESPNCWRVVNYKNYRKIKDEEALREGTRERVRECRDRKKMKEESVGDVTKSVTKMLQPVTVTVGNKMKHDVTPCRSRSRGSGEADLGISDPAGPHPDTAGAVPGVQGSFELETEQVLEGKVRKTKKDGPTIPYLELVEEWNDVAARVGAVFCTVLAKSWRGNIRARWLESVAAGKDPRAMFHSQFEAIAASPFCTGRVENKDGRPPFRAGLDFLVRADPWAKVANGNYAPQESGGSAAEDMARHLGVFDETTGGLKKPGGQS